jgi:sugar lactone lactonase YvrE
VRRSSIIFVAAAIAVATSVHAQQGAVDNSKAPVVQYESVPEPLKLPADMNFGETLSVAVNSKGEVVVLNHPGTATSGPLYGNATTQLWKFDSSGKYVGEIGKGVYGLGYAHSVRFDKYDNLWVVDKGTNSVMKFSPAGRVLLNLGRRPEGYDSWRLERPTQAEARAGEGTFNGATDVAWDTTDNIYVSDGYVNSRIAKFDKSGNFVKSWGSFGRGGDHADQNPGMFNNPHNMQIDRNNNVYVADRGNRRIHVFDTDGNFKHFLYLNAPYDKKHHPTLAAVPANAPDESAPWAMCLTPTTPQYLYVVDSEPGRLYKMTLDGKILGMMGISGHDMGQFNWPHGLACASENTVYVADMNNWRVQKIILKAPATTTSSR